MPEIHPLIKNRRSSRTIDPELSVSDEIIHTLIEAARWAPSCFNHQPWRIVVSRDTSLDAVKAALSRGNSWALDAPVILTFASKPDLGCRITGRDYYPLDLGLAIENLLLQGVSMGLVMHPIAGFDEIRLKGALRIPEVFRVHALVVAGYPLPAQRMMREQREGEAEIRTRKSIQDILTWESWFGPRSPIQ